ncbi:ribosome maturation factor RimM [Fusobacterium ulcerans]|uniref:Ribosome maturation factor RimM n=1 Tax=Fusobacterium ulcerans 12-1B TaxID=457404 RepID=H1PTY8_9FUSO|nr:ribosome maturation factor RimM [Fusobacterium ulcerans]EHO80808.1 16S rRNA processing protein RimM [Fusobacterium ulcerans 12-1B]
MELLTVGKISGTHHLKGAVKIIANIGDAEILEGNRVIVELPGGEQKIFTVTSVNPLVGNKWIAEFQEITNKTEAGKLKNSLIKIRRELLGIGEDEYLLNDLLDMKAVDADNGDILGKITDIFETAAHDILVIEGENTEIMVPDVDEFVKKIDFDKREIFIHLIEGMKEVKGQKLKQDDGIDEELEENEEK